MYKNEILIIISEIQIGDLNMRIEIKTKINSSAKKIYGIVIDGENTPNWNLIVDEFSEIEGGKSLLKTKERNITIVNSEFIENRSVILEIEEKEINSIGYLIEQEFKEVIVTFWIDFDNEKQAIGFNKFGVIILRSLKNYIDFLEEGGDPKDFIKKQILVSP